MNKTAIVLGATGLTGQHLVDLLLESEKYSHIIVFTRRTTSKTHTKLTEIICDLLTLEQYQEQFVADEVFCCIGTTKRKTPDTQTYRDIDYGIVVKAAQLAEKNAISTFSVISALGADKNSLLFYNRIKGEMEQSVLQYQIDNILIYRPSLIYGNRPEKRYAEKLGVTIFKSLPLSHSKTLHKYSAMSGLNLAKVLFNGVDHYQGHHIIAREQFIE